MHSFDGIGPADRRFRDLRANDRPYSLQLFLRPATPLVHSHNFAAGVFQLGVLSVVHSVGVGFPCRLCFRVINSCNNKHLRTLSCLFFCGPPPQDLLTFLIVGGPVPQRGCIPEQIFLEPNPARPGISHFIAMARSRKDGRDRHAFPSIGFTRPLPW